MCKKKIISSLTIFVTVLVLFGAEAATASTGDLWLGGWARRQLVTIDYTKVSGDLAGFPVLITEANIRPSLFTHARSDGFDIVVTAADGKTVLSRELASYDATAPSMELWVRIPALSKTVDTQIYLYYDNPAASVANDTNTWDENYLMVQHMNDQVQMPGTILDSTVHQFVGTKGDVPGPPESYSTVYPSVEEAGKIGKAQAFHRPLGQVAGGGWINVGVHPEFNLRQTFTVEVWANPDCLTNPCSATQYNGAVLSHDMVNTGRQWDAPILMDGDIVTMQVERNGSDQRIHAISPDYSHWNHIATTYDYLGQMAVWLNGNEYVQSSGGVLDDVPNTPLVIGTSYLFTWNANPGFIGSIDEVRVSNVVRSKEWILTGRNNQAEPSLFYSVSDEERAIYNWSGFFQPVDNLPALNSVKSGQAIPIKFSLGGNQGLSIFADGYYPGSQQIACDSGVQIDEIEQTVTAGSSYLSYDSLNDQYRFVWKTNKAWSGTCRQLVVKLIDGTEHKANFKFK